MNVLRSIAIAFSTFSRIPMPRFDWKEENMRYMLCAFPLVGVVSGGCMVLWFFICSWLGFGQLFCAIGLLVLPIAITGGIHLDGYCDVSDALASHAEPQRKREILKDPHVGAFAMIWLAVYLLIYVAALYEMPLNVCTVLLLGVAQVLSRSLSGLASLLFPLSPQKGMLAAQAEPANKKVSIGWLVAFTLISVMALVFISPWAGLVMVVAAAVCYGATYRIASHQFEGMSGDLAGFLVQLSELVMAVCLCVVMRVMLLCC